MLSCSALTPRSHWRWELPLLWRWPFADPTCVMYTTHVLISCHGLLRDDWRMIWHRFHHMHTRTLPCSSTTRQSAIASSNVSRHELTLTNLSQRLLHLAVAVVGVNLAAYSVNVSGAKPHRNLLQCCVVLLCLLQGKYEQNANQLLQEWQKERKQLMQAVGV